MATGCDNQSSDCRLHQFPAAPEHINSMADSHQSSQNNFDQLKQEDGVVKFDVLFEVAKKPGVGLAFRVAGLGSLGPEFNPHWPLN